MNMKKVPSINNTLLLKPIKKLNIIAAIISEITSIMIKVNKNSIILPLSLIPINSSFCLVNRAHNKPRTLRARLTNVINKKLHIHSPFILYKYYIIKSFKKQIWEYICTPINKRYNLNDYPYNRMHQSLLFPNSARHLGQYSSHISVKYNS